METDFPRQDLKHSKKSMNSIVAIGKNWKASFEGIISAQTELRALIRSFSQIRNVSPIGVRSPKDKVHLTPISSEMECEIVSGQISCENRAPNVENYRDSSEGTDSLAKSIHLSYISNKLNG